MLLCQIRDINSMSRGECLVPKQAQLSTMHAQLGLPDKSRAIKGLVVCNNRDLEPLVLKNGLALGCYQPSPEVLLLIVLSTLFHVIQYLKNWHRKSI